MSYTIATNQNKGVRNMKVSRNKAIQILADHGENPAYGNSVKNGQLFKNFDDGFYSHYGIRETYTIQQLRDYLGY
tara:strand:+ start:1386 stop:1610 length:225 start_codon:yes stop_codon:yes gene_type:complete